MVLTLKRARNGSRVLFKIAMIVYSVFCTLSSELPANFVFLNFSLAADRLTLTFFFLFLQHGCWCEIRPWYYLFCTDLSLIAKKEGKVLWKSDLSCEASHLGWKFSRTQPPSHCLHRTLKQKEARMNVPSGHSTNFFFLFFYPATKKLTAQTFQEEFPLFILY